jgi:hypothetical protein
MSSMWAAVVGTSLAATCAHAQPSAEEARLRAYQLAALDSICAQAKPGDALAPVCKLPAAEALREAAEAAARTPEHAFAEEVARSRALEEQFRRQAAREAARGRNLTLIGPPGFGPDPTTPLK